MVYVLHTRSQLSTWFSESLLKWTRFFKEYLEASKNILTKDLGKYTIPNNAPTANVYIDVAADALPARSVGRGGRYV